jgi:hypothetical protein
MILLAGDCLLFLLPNGESVPLRADMIAFEVSGEGGTQLDADFINQAAAAVFHYFKHDQQLPSVTMAQFCEALERVLRGFAAPDQPPPTVVSDPGCEADLSWLAGESGGNELFFYARLRAAVRERLRDTPEELRFHGLRGCVKRLAGTRRWGARCRSLRDQIVDYLRGCLQAEAGARPCSLVVE